EEPRHKGTGATIDVLDGSGRRKPVRPPRTEHEELARHDDHSVAGQVQAAHLPGFQLTEAFFREKWHENHGEQFAQARAATDLFDRLSEHLGCRIRLALQIERIDMVSPAYAYDGIGLPFPSEGRS